MRHATFLIKPASGLCNMRCRYCFYEDESEHRSVKSMGVMSPQTSEALVAAAFAAPERRGVSFAFQGGEPTLAGLGYYQNFIALVRRYNTRGLPVSYSIQTNGLAVDAAWAAFFAEHHFLVGLSVDGDKALHDEFRLDAAGKGTWARVLRALGLLQGSGVAVNLLCVVTKRCAKSPVRVYHSLKKLGVGYLQFISCLDPLGARRGALSYSLEPEAYGSFLCGLFDEWYRDWAQGRYTSVRLFDDYVHLAMGLPSGACATSGSCGGYFVVEGDGSVYPCDFYVLDEWRLGQIGAATLEQLAATETAQRFLREGAQRPAECAACPWQPLCRGGCKRDWLQENAASKNYYCPAFRAFFAHAAPRLQAIARAEWRQRRFAETGQT